MTERKREKHMKPINNYESIPETTSDFERLVPGGYICQITSAVDNPTKEYLSFTYDIVSGEHKGFAQRTMERAGFNPCKFNKSYKQTAAGFFKAFINAVHASNKNYVFDWNENSLVGKYVGIVLGEEEYRDNRTGDIKVRVTPQRFVPYPDIQNGNYKIPTLKKLKEKDAPAPAAQTFAPVIEDDSELPF